MNLLGAHQAVAGNGLLSARDLPRAKPRPNRQAIKLAKALEENPTPQVANMVINRLHETNSPQAAQFEDLISSVINDPVALRHLAQSVIRYFSETE